MAQDRFPFLPEAKGSPWKRGTVLNQKCFHFLIEIFTGKSVSIGRAMLIENVDFLYFVFFERIKIQFSRSEVPCTWILSPVAPIGPWFSSPWILAVAYLPVRFLPCHFAFLSPFVRVCDHPAAHKLSALDSSPSLPPFSGQPRFPGLPGAFPPSAVGCVGHREQLRLRKRHRTGQAT